MISTQHDIKEALDAGRVWWGFYRRGGPSMYIANVFTDLSYSAGIPVANYYASAPLVSAVMSGSEGIDVGPLPAAGMTKYVKRVLIMPPTTVGIMEFELLDIVMYYPFVDGDGGAQNLSNTVSIPRYGGTGCKIMVVSQGAGSGIVSAVVTYTNAAGVSGKTVTVNLNLAAAAGSLCSSFPPAAATSQLGAYLPWAVGDTGVRSIESVEYLSAGGGIQAFVIVKPLASIPCWEATVAPVEVDFMCDRSGILPVVPNGAYLGFIARGTASGTPATVHAQLETIWG